MAPPRYIWQRADWPQWRWSTTQVAPLLDDVQRKQDFLAGLARALDTDHLGLAVAELTARETVSTSAIEGVRLDPDEVRSSIMRRLGLGAGERDADHLTPAARGMIDVLADSTQNLRQLTLKRLFAWHSALFPSGRSGLSLILVGMLRGDDPMQVLSGPVGRERIHFEAPPRDRLDREMRRFLQWFNGSRDSAAIVRASIAHLWFETLHPFEDGNGRLGRAVFDLALAQGAGFHSGRTSRLWAVSPVLMKRRKEYYTQLEGAQKGNLDITGWLEWSATCVGQACEEARLCIERVVQIAHFWARHRDTPLTPRQRRLLQMALAPDDPDQGWLTAKRAARQTKVERVTSSRDLSRLEELGVIERDPTAGGRSTRYRVRLGEERPVLLVKDMDWS
ncbi:MAG TPA: Fic family protein [Steroidobacteraceae bacterium]|nr:Fic family protein [Steroidobacteraceae bacterium]